MILKNARILDMFTKKEGVNAHIEVLNGRNASYNAHNTTRDFEAGQKANPNKYTEEQMFGFAKYMKDKDLVGAYSNTLEKWLELYLNK